MSKIADNLNQLEQQITEICQSCGRAREEVELIAVTKTRMAEEINEAIDWGVTQIGENKVQEIMDKYEHVKPVRWHMIGHLQTNKVKYIVDKVFLIHSVDSFRLAEEIDKRAGEKGIQVPILVQVNAAGEESKFGVDVKETDALIDSIHQNCRNLIVEGLMTIAPYDPDPEQVRPYFRQMRQLFEKYRSRADERMTFRHLSMGMSSDFPVAIEEGATMIRVGTAIFGERNYNQ